MKILRSVAYLLVSVVVLFALVVFGARFADGPIGLIAGGAFTSGDRVDGPEPDWAFVRDIGTVELQLLNPARSRTTWIIEHEGKVYIPCGYMSTAWGRLWKKWPLEAEQDGRAMLRVSGKLYARRLVRVYTGAALAAVIGNLAWKYNVPATMDAVTSNALWMFELAPRESGA